VLGIIIGNYIVSALVVSFIVFSVIDRWTDPFLGLNKQQAARLALGWVFFGWLYPILGFLWCLFWLWRMAFPRRKLGITGLEK